MVHRSWLAFPLAAVLVCVASALGGCGSTTTTTITTVAAGAGTVPKAHPQAIDPVAGQQAAAAAAQVAQDPVGDPNARPMPLSEVQHLLSLEHVAVKPNSAGYINPLHYVTHWERTDQGVDATMPVGAPILAPCSIKILATIPNWYAGQPLVYFELLDGVDAGSVQYVAEEITDIALPGSILAQGQTIARFARSGTGIEYGLSTLSGVTMARATTGYEEGQVTPAGVWIRNWLNALGAHAGPS